MKFVFKVNFKTKSYKNNKKNRGVKYKGEIYFEYQKINNIVSILNAQLVLKEAEYNGHQQPTLSSKKGKRESFEKKFSLSFNSKKYIQLNKKQIEWWNTHLHKESILSISKYLTGNNPAGSQQKKKNAEFILDEAFYNEMPFFNLLKVFSINSIKSKYITNKKDAKSFKEFLTEISDLNENYKYVIENFYSDKKFFYIDEMKDYIGEEIDDIKKMRRVFRNDLISKYERKDQFYNFFVSRKMVEASHILPVKIIKSSPEYDNELIKDVDNGLLLSPDIHKLFDSGAITFSPDTGKVEYTTNTKKYPYNLSKKEVEHLKLNNHKLSDNVLSSAKRRDMLVLHKKLVYQRGI